MSKDHEYTVCFLFDSALENVLLVRKARTRFKGRLNGVGGEVNATAEAPAECAVREIREETGIKYSGLKSLGLTRLAFLGTLSLLDDCKYQDGNGCVLHYYAGAMKPGTSYTKTTDTGEELVLEPVADILEATVDNVRYAGDGDLQYFVNAGLNAMRRYLPGKE